ncbi:MAG: HEPN domain-containing protein [Nanoarchaeota archaeon]
MSQAEKKVQWCLKKATKELKEQGIHRGLVQVEPNKNQVKMHLDKAQHNFNAALFFDKHGYSNWSASAFFYCAYHCCLAIIRKHGYESRNQECTLAVIEFLREEGIIEFDQSFIDMLLIAKANEVDVSIIGIREDFQYGVERTFANREVFTRLSETCKNMLEKTRSVVYREEAKK